MLSRLLVCAAIVCAATPALAQVQRTAELELVVRVQESRLSLFNPTDAPELIVLADRANGRQATIAIAPHAELQYRFMARALQGLDFAVFARGADGMRTTGWTPVELLRAQSDDQTTCFSACRDHIHVWLWSDGEWTPLEGQRLPGAPHFCTAPPPPAPLHVPVITPTDSQHGDVPPRLEKPLPPV